MTRLRTGKARAAAQETALEAWDPRTAGGGGGRGRPRRGSSVLVTVLFGKVEGRAAFLPSPAASSAKCCCGQSNDRDEQVVREVGERLFARSAKKKTSLFLFFVDGGEGKRSLLFLVFVFPASTRRPSHVEKVVKSEHGTRGEKRKRLSINAKSTKKSEKFFIFFENERCETADVAPRRSFSSFFPIFSTSLTFVFVLSRTKTSSTKRRTERPSTQARVLSLFHDEQRVERPAIVARGARHRTRRRGRRRRSGGSGGRLLRWCRACGGSASSIFAAAIIVFIAARKIDAFALSPGPLFRLCFLPRRGACTSGFETG